MEYYPLKMLQQIFLATFLGVGSLILVYIAWAAYPRRRQNVKGDSREEEEKTEPPGSQDNPMSPLLVFIYVGTVAWALGYMIVIGIFGKAIG